MFVTRSHSTQVQYGNRLFKRVIFSMTDRKKKTKNMRWTQLHFLGVLPQQDFQRPQAKSRLFYSQVMPLLLITSDNSLDEKQEALALWDSIHRTHLFNLLKRFTKLIFLFRIMLNLSFMVRTRDPWLASLSWAEPFFFFFKFQWGDEPVVGKHVWGRMMPTTSTTKTCAEEIVLYSVSVRLHYNSIKKTSEQTEMVDFSYSKPIQLNLYTIQCLFPH